MTNQMMNLVYLPFLIISAILFAAVLRNNRRSFLNWQCIGFYGCLTVWISLEMLTFTLKNHFWIRYVYDLKLIVVTFNAVSLFLLLLGFYRLNRIFPSQLPAALSAIPAVTTVLALTSPWHNLLRSEFVIVSTEPFTLVRHVRAPWFYIHMLYCQLLVVAIGVVILVFYRSLPKAYRSGSVLMLSSILFYLAGTIVETSRLDNNPLDFTVICACIGSIFFYMAIIVYGRASYLNIERQEIFNYLDVSVFILDDGGRVVDINSAAESWLATLETPLTNIPFDELVERLKAERKITVKPAEEGAGEYLYLTNTRYPLIFRMLREQLVDDRGDVVGFFVTVADITRNRLFVERLRELAGVDPLTGLYNRHGYHEELRRLDHPDNLPLTVIMGDVNGLKRVNDEVGHEAGDKLLQYVAKVIKDCCPEDGIIARIGGDEFAVLLPRCGNEEGKCLIRDIQVRMSALATGEYQAAIAMGAATKTGAAENLNSLVTEADRLMYRAK